MTRLNNAAAYLFITEMHNKNSLDAENVFDQNLTAYYVKSLGVIRIQGGYVNITEKHRKRQ